MNRWKEVFPQILTIAKLRPKVGAALGDDTAALAESLARKARELRFWMDHDLEMKRVGPEVVAMWNDQNFVERTKQSVVVAPERGDPFSTEFTAILDQLLDKLRPHL